jgi:hypothetical protein
MGKTLDLGMVAENNSVAVWLASLSGYDGRPQNPHVKHPIRLIEH